MKTDVHNHAIPTTVLDLLRTEAVYNVHIDGNRWRGGNHVDFKIADSFVDPGAKLAELDANGIEAAVISVAPPLFYYELEPTATIEICAAANEGMREMCAARGGRLSWLAHVPMQDPAAAAAVLDALLAEPGCVGVEIGSSIDGGRLDHPRFDPFWEAAESLRAPVLIHPDLTYEPNPSLSDYYLQNVIGLPLETTITVERLICAGVLERRPGLRIILVHAGGYFPYQAGRVKHARTVRPELANSPDDPWAFLPQLWFDVITHDREALRYLAARVGIENLVFGTDLPFDMALPDPVAAVESALESAEAVERITEHTPAELFGLPAPAAPPGPGGGDPA